MAPGRHCAQPDWLEARRLALATARSLGLGPAEAEDVAQEALIRAWRSERTLRDVEAFNPWLATIVRREASRWRKRRGPGLGEVAERDAVEEPGFAAAVIGADLAWALRRLSKAEREILYLRYTLDLKQTQVAERLGIPEGTAKVRLHRARNHLHRQLEGP